MGVILKSIRVRASHEEDEDDEKDGGGFVAPAGFKFDDDNEFVSG